MDWKFAGSKPVYLQIMEQFRAAVLSGEYPPGGRVPSVRELAAEARVNPNTVQRALTELEREGLLTGGGTTGRWVTEDEETLEALRQQAKAYLPGRVALWAKRMGLAPAAVKITSARTRFGSCSSKGSLCFSLYLMQYPTAAIDAVVVHELCHMRHHDHSPAFYAEVERWLPDYRQREKLLKK